MRKSSKLTLTTCDKISVVKTDKPNVYKIIYEDKLLRNSTLIEITQEELLTMYNVSYGYKTIWSNSGKVLFLDVATKGIVEEDVIVLPDTLNDFLRTIDGINNLLIYSDTYTEIKDETNASDS